MAAFSSRNTDAMIEVDSDDKLDVLTEYYLSRPRRKQASQPLNNIENHSML